MPEGGEKALNMGNLMGNVYLMGQKCCLLSQNECNVFLFFVFFGTRRF